MRLTLRTLLAYLDDTLNPSDSKELGRKIQESEFALQVMNRVREVVRRRRLSAPEIDSDTDPNVVAEYLDNILTPEEVTDIEKICLESDLHLAEVASLHQVLTHRLAEHVEVSQISRERMYALIPPEQPAAKPTPPVAPPSNFHDTIPELLKPRPIGRSILTGVAIVSAVSIWIGSVYYDRIFHDQDSPELAANQTDAMKFPEVNLGPEGDIEELDQVPETTDTTEVMEPQEKGKPATKTSIDAPPPEDAPDEENTTDSTEEFLPPKNIAGKQAPQPDEQNPEGTSNEKGNTLEPETSTKVAVKPNQAIPEPKDPPMPAKGNPVAIARSATGVTLFQSSEGGWKLLPRRSQLSEGESVAIPEPFLQSFELGESKLSLDVSGGTSIQFLGKTDAAPIGISLRKGSVILSRTDNNPEPLPIGIKIQNELFRVDLQTMETRIGIQVQLRQPSRFEEDFGGNTWTGELIVVSGSARVADGVHAPQLVEAGMSFPLGTEPRAKVAATDPVPVSTIQPLPTWLSVESTRTTAFQLKNVEDFFHFDTKAADDLIPQLDHKNADLARLASEALSLVEDSEGMVRALARSPHSEARLAAIRGLRNWINLDPSHREVLKEQLAKQFHETEADAIYRLVWGFDVADAREPSTSELLVNWLEDNEVAIRELSFYHIFRLTGRRNDYRSSDSPQQRKAGVKLWRRHLDMHGALLNGTP